MTTTTRRRKSHTPDWCVMASRDHVSGARCERCGEFEAMPVPMPVTAFGAWVEYFGVRHEHCRDTGRVDPTPTSVEEWSHSFDTGISSMAIYRHMRGMMPDPFSGANPPQDPSDFGRCYRLLQIAPAWRARIGEMAKYLGWGGLAEAWEELTALYELELPTGNAPRLYARMKALR